MNRMNWESIGAEEAAMSPPPAVRPVTIELDINSNLDTTGHSSAGGLCSADELDSGTESDALSSPVSAASSAASSEIDELPTDITQVHSNIALVAERMDWGDNNTGCGDRRPSLPVTLVTELSPASVPYKDSYARRESFPRIHDNRRTRLPHSGLYQAFSFDQLVEKLTNMERHHLTTVANSASVKNSVNAVNLDNLLSETRLSTLSPSLETSKITNYLVNSKQLVYK